MNLKSILYKFPYFAVLLSIIIFTIRGIAVEKVNQYNKANLKYEEYIAFLIKWIGEKNLSGLLPFLSLFGVGQFLAPNSATGGKAVMIITNILLVIILCISELWYGHLGLIIFLVLCILTYTFAFTLQSLSCKNNDSQNKNNIFTQQIATGTFLVVFFAGVCVNILLSFGVVGIISAVVIHCGLFGMLFGLDYNKTFKNTKTKNEKICYTFLNHIFGYLLGASVSLFIIFTAINIKFLKLGNKR